MRTLKQSEQILQGVPLSDGIAVARVCMFNESRHSNLPHYQVAGAGIDLELARSLEANKIAREKLEKIRTKVEQDIGPAEAGIFTAQIMILEDEALQIGLDRMIRTDKVNAETAVAAVLDAYEAKLLALDDEYIKERASDFGEIKRRLLDELRNMSPSLQCDEAHCQRGKNRIIVAGELTPQITVDLDTGHTMGFVAEHGGRNSHAAILARALGIPAVSGIKGLRDRVHCGMEILLNGTSGEVILRPRERTIVKLRSRQPDKLRQPQSVEPVPGFRVMANISVASEAQDALQMQAEGIGLYRTEIELIAQGGKLSEDDLYHGYSSVAQSVDGAAVYFRLFDIGSDKTLPSLSLPREQNPALGLRGARLLLARKDLWQTQAQALCRLSLDRPTHVLYPMIIDAEQFMALRRAFAEATAGRERGTLLHGAMIEVPSACLTAGELLDVADFASVGTNDLLQYLFAVDRDNEHVIQDYHPDHPLFWELMGSMAAASVRAGKLLSVCGEVAGDPKYIPKLMDAGISTVSVSARSIPVVRAAARLKLDASQGS